ncbi:MAG: TetR/AcrR family transcriptional regulator [Mycobacteriaceae bacterium]|nr:TetR/AcrR family transcriptional regulator [Mycobacteriaceae bacterium]
MARTQPSQVKPGPRERLLRAARDLTYRDGVHVGVDAILKEADAARRSLYEHFGGKDGLIAEMLRESAAADEAWYRTTLDACGTDPRARILGLFDALDPLVCAPEFRGCRFTAADLSLADPANPAHGEARGHKQRVHDMLRRELERLGHPAPALGAAQLQLLIEGVMVRALMDPESHPARAAKQLAHSVVGPP